MDIRWIIALVTGFIAWATVTKTHFELMGHQFVVPVLAWVMLTVILVLVALIAFLAHLILSDMRPIPAALAAPGPGWCPRYCGTPGCPD